MQAPCDSVSAVLWGSLGGGGGRLCLTVAAAHAQDWLLWPPSAGAAVLCLPPFLCGGSLRLLRFGATRGRGLWRLPLPTATGVSVHRGQWHLLQTTAALHAAVGIEPPSVHRRTAGGRGQWASFGAVWGVGCGVWCGVWCMMWGGVWGGVAWRGVAWYVLPPLTPVPD